MNAIKACAMCGAAFVPVSSRHRACSPTCATRIQVKRFDWLSARRRRVMAMARPSALPQPHERHVAAFTKADVLDRWSEDAAGVRAVAMGDGVITMFDIIGEDFWSGGGITAKSVTAQLRAIGDRPVEVQINSPGGDMFEGIAIYNVLREHPQPVTVKVMGMAASAASVIAMAGDTVEIGAASFLMIHDCWVLAMGNRHDMAATAAWLEPFDHRHGAGLRRDRTGQRPRTRCAEWMDANDVHDGTYFSTAQSIELGFADGPLAGGRGQGRAPRREGARPQGRRATS